MNMAGIVRQRFTGFCLITVRGQTMRNRRPCFVWRFYSGQNSAYLTTTATSEREARLQLPAVRLVFVARIRVEGVSHV
ncbi:host cell division inhibitor Icd-like protein [Salmonella enterica subsp. diarizonae]|nr:host cell division inhibitor Icd-like protein [Salmonella enterica]ECC3881104.1 host cell division inhibitor Icd-like protein [Salmonella enterica subsp. diarizonae]EDQ7407966.1 host cell division inhibitor Icd-like protein [Salmonella enterica subsp. diarizonae]